MAEQKTIAMKDLVPIKEIKENLNLALFNSPLFSFEDLKATNQLMEALNEIKIRVPHN